jgi:hypothetical protein
VLDSGDPRSAGRPARRVTEGVPVLGQIAPEALVERPADWGVDTKLQAQAQAASFPLERWVLRPEQITCGWQPRPRAVDKQGGTRLRAEGAGPQIGTGFECVE